MRQLLVECSDPGLIITLAEDLENVFRHIDFERAKAIQASLSGIARELGPEVEEAWKGFRLEVSNDGVTPPAFGCRDAGPGEKEPLRRLLAQAAERGLGKFEVGGTSLLPQDGPAPETPEQYVRDLADAIRWGNGEDLIVSRHPVPLPAPMETHRRRLVQEQVAPVLEERAAFPAVAHEWVSQSVKRVEKSLEGVDQQTRAVMVYELGRLDPKDASPEERTRWAALAVRLGKEVEKWCGAAEEPLGFLWQRAALVEDLWNEAKGLGPARGYLGRRFESLIEEARSAYHADGVAALQLLYDDLRRSPWDRLPRGNDSPFLAED